MIDRQRTRRLVPAGALASSLVIAMACGTDYAELPAVSDAGGEAARTDSATTTTMDASATTDSAPSGPRCDHRKPFKAVTRVAGLPDGASCARLSADESIVTFSYGNESRVATRGTDGAFGPAATVPLTDTKGICLTSSADRRRVFYEDFFAVLQQLGEPGGPYSGKQTISAASSKFGIGRPFFDEPRGLLYVDYHLTPNYFQNVAIGVATVTGGTTGEFRRVDVGFGVTGGDEPIDGSAPATYTFYSATPSADGLAMYFSTNRNDTGKESPDLDVWVSTRTSLDEDFRDPKAVDGVNSAFGDAPTWLSPDNCRLYLQSVRDDPSLFAASMFVAVREP